MVGSVSSSTAPALLGSPAVASVVIAVVAIVVVVVPEASVLPSLSQLTPEARDQSPCLLRFTYFLLPESWPPLAIWPLTKDNAKDKNEEEDTEEDPHGDVSGLWQYNDPDTV